MSTLPTAATVAGKVQPERLRGVNVARDAFEVPGLEQGLRQVQSTISQFAIEEARLNSQTEAQDLSNRLNAEARRLEHGDARDEDLDDDGAVRDMARDDLEMGYLNRLNNDAIQDRKKYEDKFRDLRKQLELEATSEGARRMFKKAADQREARFLNTVGTHFREQRKTYRAQVLKTTIAEAEESAIVDYNNPDHVADIYDATFRYQRDLGMSVEVAKSLAQEARSKAHLSVVKSLGVKNAVAAEDYLEKHKDQIDPDLRAGALKPLMENVRMQRANEDLALVSKDYALNTTKGDKAAFKFLRKKYKNNSAQLAVSEKRLKNELVRLEELEEDEQEDLLLSATKKLQADPNALLTDAELNAILATSNGFASLANLRTKKRRISDKDSQKALAEFSDDHAKREKNGTVLTPGQYKVKYYNKMNPPEYNAGLRKVQAWHTAKTKKDASDQEKAEAASQLRLSKRIKNTLLEAGLISYKTGTQSFSKKTNLRLAAFELRVANLIEEFASDKGAKATTEEISNIINKELVNIVYVDPEGVNFSDEQRPAAMVVDELAERVYVPINRLRPEYRETLREKLMDYGLLSFTTPLEDQNKRIEDFAGAIARGKKAQVRYLKALRKQLNDADE